MEVMAKGTMKLVEVEDCQDTPKDYDCPCCGGSGEHATLPGVRPDNDVYMCWTCNGSGCFKVL